MNQFIREAIGSHDVGVLLGAWRSTLPEESSRCRHPLLRGLSVEELRAVCRLTEEAMLAGLPAAEAAPSDALAAINEEAQEVYWHRRYGAESLKTLYLDTETTGLYPSFPDNDRIVELAIVNGAGEVLVDTLVNPERLIPTEATGIHGISDVMVESAPTLAELWPDVRELVEGRHIVIYNAQFDRGFFPNGLRNAARISCAMLRFAEVFGERRGRRGYKWQRLFVAAAHVGHEWTGEAHRALADTLACRSVWQWLEVRDRT
jgi:DNA polymerase III epsilon subunit-like protein